MFIGYARVSRPEQVLTLQHDALQQAGCERFYEETITGAHRDRPQLEAALAYMRAGDTLVIWKLDRLGRSLRDLIDLSKLMAQRGLGLKSLQEQLDTTTPGGKLIFHMFAALAEFERDIIRERTQAGLAAARARGRVGGRPRKMTPEKLTIARDAMASPTHNASAIARLVGINRTVLYRYVQADGRLTPLGQALLGGQGDAEAAD
jgi:DNA invertase Pin-like site-specific DNA recombinase